MFEVFAVNKMLNSTLQSVHGWLLKSCLNIYRISYYLK